VAFLNWRFGLTRRPLWRIEVAPFPDVSNVATPTKPIITIPITLYIYGNGDDAKEGSPEGGAMGWSVPLFLYPKGRTRRLQRRALSRLYSLCSRCRVSLPTRTVSSSSLCRLVSSLRSPGDEHGQGLCHVSSFYTTLVKKSQQANGASELPRTPLLRTRVTNVSQ
jgi:hypothetical protein